MTPHQKAGLVAYRDKGTPLSGHLRRLMRRKGIIDAKGSIKIDLDSIDTRTIREKVGELSKQGKTIDQICDQLDIEPKQVYQVRHVLAITTPTKRPNARQQLTKTNMRIGTFDDFCAACPDVEAILDLAATSGTTFFAAAGELLRRNS